MFLCCCFFTETPPPGYISEDGETSDQQMNQSMETGRLVECRASVHAAVCLTGWKKMHCKDQKISFDNLIYFLVQTNVHHCSSEHKHHKQHQ